jgi:hypothetical protein
MNEDSKAACFRIEKSSVRLDFSIEKIILIESRALHFSPILPRRRRNIKNIIIYLKDVFQLSIAEFSQTVSSVPPRGETGGQKDSIQREGLVHNGRVVRVFSVFAITFVWYFKHERGGSFVLGAGYHGFKQRNNHGVGDIADYYLRSRHAAVDGE